MFVHDLQVLADSFLTLFFPRLCNFCDAVGADSAVALCESCQDNLKPVPPRVCAQCGIPFGGIHEYQRQLCGTCLLRPPPYSRARYGFVYSDQLREGIVRFKYGGRLHLGRTLGELLIDAFKRHFSDERFDVIIPVPIHQKRLLQRGFNHTVILGESLSAVIQAPVDRTCCGKIRNTPPQVGLSREERLTNLKGSFGVANPSEIIGKRVLLIDDVATTGSTIFEVSKTLINAGAVMVDALVLALRTGTIEAAPAKTTREETPNGSHDS